MLKSTKEENMNTSAYDSIIPMTGQAMHTLNTDAAKQTK